MLEKRVSKNGNIYYARNLEEKREERKKEWLKRGSWMPEGNQKEIMAAYLDQKGSGVY